MNDPSLNDPHLQSFEARLATMAPHEPLARQQELLYRCAFAAGQRAAEKTVRRWQAAVAALALLLVGMSVPLARNQLLVARQPPKPVAPLEAVQPPKVAQHEAPPTLRQPAIVDLDAWQVPSAASASLDNELAQFQEADPGLRTFAVGTLTRAVFEP